MWIIFKMSQSDPVRKCREKKKIAAILLICALLADQGQAQSKIWTFHSFANSVLLELAPKRFFKPGWVMLLFWGLHSRLLPTDEAERNWNYISVEMLGAKMNNAVLGTPFDAPAWGEFRNEASSSRSQSENIMEWGRKWQMYHPIRKMRPPQMHKPVPLKWPQSTLCSFVIAATKRQPIFLKNPDTQSRLGIDELINYVTKLIDD